MDIRIIRAMSWGAVRAADQLRVCLCVVRDVHFAMELRQCVNNMYEEYEHKWMKSFSYCKQTRRDTLSKHSLHLLNQLAYDMRVCAFYSRAGEFRQEIRR